MKRLFIIVMSIALASEAFAQQLKIIGGMNLAKYPQEPALVWIAVAGYHHEPAYKPGFLGGIGIEFALTRNIALEIDGLYIQKGSHYVYSFNKEGNIKHNLNVISALLLIKFKFLQGSSPYVLGGYEYSTILSHEYSDNLGGQILEKQDVKDFTKSTDDVIVLGGGYEFRKKAVSFSVEGRYHHGYKNISKGYELYPKITTRALVLILGLKFHL